MEPVTPLFNFTGRFDSGLSDLVALDNRGLKVKPMRYLHPRSSS